MTDDPTEQAAPDPAPDATPEDDSPELAEALERLESGETLYWCDECGAVRSDDDTGVIRACTKCGDEMFSMNENGRNCPDCNSPFTRRELERGCDSCFAEVEGPLDAEALREHLGPGA